MNNTLICGGLVAVGLMIVTADPALAGPGRNGYRNARGAGQGLCQQNGTLCQGRAVRSGFRPGGRGSCRYAPVTPLGDAEVASLTFLYEQEKMAGDVYAAMASLWSNAPFLNLERAERNHQSALMAQLRGRGLATADLESKGPGEFVNPDILADYNRLVSAGGVSLVEAIRAGVSIEQADIAHLSAAITETSAPELRKVYTNLKEAAERHLGVLELRQ